MDRLASRSQPPWEFLLFPLCVAVIVAANWQVIGAPRIESGDSAANSLLILDAKRFALLKGNYSRLDFNHPGPVILYVLAAGEALFHDALGWAASPISGQLLAVAVYNAFWIVLIVRSLRATLGSPVAALLATSAFLFATALCDAEFYSSLWFPHLYFFPFAALCVAAMRLAQGEGDRLIALALSAGFLVEGHVSFFAFIPAMLGAMVAINRWQYRRSEPERRIASPRFAARHRAALLFASGLFALFLVPIAIESFLHPPGPVPSYLAFGGERHRHGLGGALQFAKVYWGGMPSFIAGLVALGLTTRLGVGDAPVRTVVRSLIAIVASATVALMAYAIFGIDSLGYAYLGYFYFAVPCLSIAVMACCLLRTARHRRSVALALSIPMLVVVPVLIRLSSDYRDDRPDMQLLYGPVKAAASQGRIVLDLDPGFKWTRVWATVVGVEVYAKRRGEDLFCIREGWSILFTPSARCTPDELRNGKRYAVRAGDGFPVDAARPEFARLGLGFFRLDGPTSPTVPAAGSD